MDKMELRTQLLVLDIISWCGFILTTIVFCSPQWVILTTSVNDSGKSSEILNTYPLHMTTFVQDIQDEGHDRGKIQTADLMKTRHKSLIGQNNRMVNQGNSKKITNGGFLTKHKSMLANTNGHDHIKTTDDSLSKNSTSKVEESLKTDFHQMKLADRMNKQVQRTEKLLLTQADDQMENADDTKYNTESLTSNKHVRSTVTLQAGLWFFMTCVSNVTDETCYVNRYGNVQYNLQILPAGMVWLRQLYEKIRVTSTIGLLEFRCEACIGLVFSFVGSVAIVSYKKSLAEKRGYGIVACLSFFLSGGMILTAVGKVATSIAQLQILYGKCTFKPFHVPVPPCLVVGAIGATFTLAGAISLVFVLSRDRKKDQNHESVDSCHTKGLLPYHILDQ